MTYGKLHEDAIALSNHDPLRHGFPLEHWVKADELLQTYDTLFASGGNRCLAGWQEVYDPVQQKSLRVDEIDGDFHVYAWDNDTNEQVIAPAGKPYRKPHEMLYDVTLSNGQVISCSEGHRVATPFGWRSLSSLSVGQLLFSHRSGEKSFFSRLRERLSCFLFQPQSSLGRILLVWLQDALCLKQTLQDLRGHCLSSRHFYDAQLLSEIGYDPILAPSLGDVPKCREYVFDEVG